MMHQRYLIIFLLGLTACHGSQFAGWQRENFEQTAITQSLSKAIIVGSAEEDENIHLISVGFDQGSNGDGHFQIDSVQVGSQTVAGSDIVVPPKTPLLVNITYSPMNLKTTVADYGGWVSGETTPWIPKLTEETAEAVKQPSEAIHRAIIQAVYDYPKEGMVAIELVGKAVPGPGGELAISRTGGPCTAGGGVACYAGGFDIDIPKLYTTGPRPLKLTGPIRFSFSSTQATLKLDDFPVVLMYLKSTEIPQLPAGTTATLVISGSRKVTATGSFDGSRLSLKGVGFRIRVVMGEIKETAVTLGMAAMVDFDLKDLELTTSEALTAGNITLRIETTLNATPSNQPLFDQFLGGAKIIVTMKGQLAY